MFNLDHMIKDHDVDFNDGNPYLIMAQHASLGLGDYQIEDVSYNI